MERNICIFGDSITWGANDSQGGWVMRLQKDFFNQKEFLIYNCGVSGDNSKKLLERFKIEAAARSPFSIVFAIGVNDSQYLNLEHKNRVPIDEFRSNLTTISLQAKEFCDSIIFLGLNKVDENKTTPIPWNTEEEYHNEFVKEYDDAIRVFCKENNFIFIEINELISKEELEDGLHPNDKGHEKIYKKVKEVLFESLV